MKGPFKMRGFPKIAGTSPVKHIGDAAHNRQHVKDLFSRKREGKVVESTNIADDKLSIANYKEANLYQEYASQQYEKEYNEWVDGSDYNQPPPTKPLTLDETLKQEGGITYFNAEGWNEDGTARFNNPQ